MTSPKQATTSRAGQRFYTWRNERYFSVTTIINGGVPKPALINWAKKFTAEYAVEHFDAFAMLVKDDPDGAIEWLKGAAYRDRDRKAELGTELHTATEAYVLGKPMPPWSLPIRPVMKNFEAFLADYKPNYLATEASVFNRSERYAGTLDAIAEIDGRRYLIDVKSGKGIYSEIALQLAGYRFAEFIGLPDGSEEPMHEVDACAALHLPADGRGYELTDVRADEDVFKTFLYIRECFRWTSETQKTVLLGSVPLPGNAMVQATLPLAEAGAA
jgi:hypothetical protein